MIAAWWVGVGGCGCERRKKWFEERKGCDGEAVFVARGWPEGEIHAKRSLGTDTVLGLGDGDGVGSCVCGPHEKEGKREMGIVGERRRAFYEEREREERCVLGSVLC
jgi:hypothetical protein